MSKRVAISIEDLGKSFSIRHKAERQRYVALRDVIAEKAKGLFRPARSPAANGSSQEAFWAVRNVWLEIKQGEVIGIIGRNGAGKSTLLKVLSHITEPTEGRVRLRGRVASLLEVGTGFHPELTGRENIFLNGAILGMSRSEVKRKFDEIVAFAEVEKFLDTPVKRYSSGMYMRLAFAVAAHLESEILIVDEVLAVGDSDFQKKCLGKMEGISGSGRTVILVSHQMANIGQLCSRVIWLDKGKVRSSGKPTEIIGTYLASGASTGGTVEFDSPGQGAAFAFVSAGLANGQRETSTSFGVHSEIVVRLRFRARSDIAGFIGTIRVTTGSGVPVFSLNRPASLLKKGDYRAEVTIPKMFLMPGQYTLTIAGHRLDGEIYCVHQDCMLFDVIETGSNMARYNHAGCGVVLVDFPWQEERAV